MNHALRRSDRVSYADYVAGEEVAAVRSEYYDGEIFNMAGGTPDHAWLIASMIRILGNKLHRSGCSVYASDLRLRYAHADAASYPDVMVFCGTQQVAADDPHALTNPRVIVEVLSPSTESWDRSGKFALATGIPSLEHYLLVHQDTPRIEHLTRGEGGAWRWTEARAGEVLRLGELLELPVDEVYDGLDEDRARRAPPV